MGLGSTQIDSSHCVHVASCDNRAQVAVEYMSLVWVVLIIIAGLSSYAYITYNQAVTTSQINNTFTDLRTGVDTVHSLGNGNTIIVTTTLPNNVTQFYVLNNALYLTTSDIMGTNENILPFDYNISNTSGNLSSRVGQHIISITSTKNAFGQAVVDLNEVA